MHSFQLINLYATANEYVPDSFILNIITIYNCNSIAIYCS